MDRPAVPLSGTAGRLCMKGRHVPITAFAPCTAIATSFSRITFSRPLRLPLKPASVARDAGSNAAAASTNERNWVTKVADMSKDAGLCGCYRTTCDALPFSGPCPMWRDPTRQSGSWMHVAVKGLTALPAR
jgi:hypothetical protein